MDHERNRSVQISTCLEKKLNEDANQNLSESGKQSISIPLR